jgi:hypothetical protein
MAKLNGSVSGFVRTASLFWTAIFLLFATGCGLNLNEFRTQKEKLEPLVAQHAPKEGVIALLGTNYVVYSKGDQSWTNLTWYFQRIPTNQWPDVRKGAERWPKVMSWSTPDMMTWVFFDRDDRVVDYVVGAQ